MRWLRLLAEIVSYLCLLVVASGIGAAVYAATSGLCPQFSTAGIRCVTPFARQVADYGFSVVLVSTFTGFPVLFALAGIGFLIWRLIRRADARKAAARQVTRV